MSRVAQIEEFIGPLRGVSMRELCGSGNFVYATVNLVHTHLIGFQIIMLSGFVESLQFETLTCVSEGSERWHRSCTNDAHRFGLDGGTPRSEG
jgi:hypothetical protein